MKRKEAREYAASIVFQIDTLNDWDNFNPCNYIEQDKTGDQKTYIEILLGRVKEHLPDIDNIINTVSDGWTTGRMAKMDLAILRTAAAEIIYIDEVPKAVAINEAVNIAKKYGSEQSPGFINAILGKIDG